MKFNYSDYAAFEKWMDEELGRIDRLEELIDQELTRNSRKPLKAYYKRMFAGQIHIVELLCGKIYALDDRAKPLGLISAHPEICFTLKETDKLAVKLGWKENYWHILSVDSIEHAGPEEDFVNQQRKHEQFLRDNPAMAEIIQKINNGRETGLH